MVKSSNKKLKKLGRAELLELLVKQGEQLDKTKEALAAAEERAAYQERIARLAEKAMSRLAGLLEATELAHDQYSDALAELKSQMGIAYTGEKIKDTAFDANAPLLPDVAQSVSEAATDPTVVPVAEEPYPEPIPVAATAATAAATAAPDQTIPMPLVQEGIAFSEPSFADPAFVAAPATAAADHTPVSAAGLDVVSCEPVWEEEAYDRR